MDATIGMALALLHTLWRPAACMWGWGCMGGPWWGPGGVAWQPAWWLWGIWWVFGLVATIAIIIGIILLLIKILRKI